MMPPREGPPMESRTSRIGRRQFVAGTAGLGLLAGCGRLPGQSEVRSAANRPRIGCLYGSGLASVVGSRFDDFRQGLSELGYVAGRTIDIEFRSAEGDIARLPGLAAELVGLQVDVLVTGGPVPTQAAKNATTTIPI